MRFVFWDTRFYQNLKGDGACDLSNFFQTLGIRISSDLCFGIRISSKLLGGRGLRFVAWDTNFFQTLRGTGLAICLILRGTGLAICLLGYAFLPKS